MDCGFHNAECRLKKALTHFESEIRNSYSAIDGPTRYRVVVLNPWD